MSDTAAQKPAFGVNAVISETFAVWRQNIGKIYIAGLVPQLIVFALIFVVGALSPVLAQSNTNVGVIGSIVGLLYALLSLAAGALSTAIVVRIAYDSISGRSVDLGAAVSGALPHIVPIAVLSFLMLLGAGLAALLLIIPGLYLYAMWSVFAPAIVVEKAGYGGLGRSAALTKDYRWPIVGTLVIFFVVMILASIIVAALFTAVLGEGLTDFIVTVFINPLLFGPAYVVSSMIYARLREIKEGVAVQDLAEVFA